MAYETPLLSLIGTTASIILGSSMSGKSDNFPESNKRKTGTGIEEDVDD